jgi:branched-chain amino acid transport system ATP-binding protein
MIDELSLGLAPLVVARLLDVVRATAEAGMGVLIVEQYARRALSIADRAYVMRRGRIEVSGSAAEVRERHEEVEGIYLSTKEGF